MHQTLFLLLAIVLLSCHKPVVLQTETQVSAQPTRTTSNSTPIQTGAEQIEQYLPLLKGKKVALVVNQTSVVGKQHLVDTLLALDINITKVFAHHRRTNWLTHFVVVWQNQKTHHRYACQR